MSDKKESKKPLSLEQLKLTRQKPSPTMLKLIAHQSDLQTARVKASGLSKTGKLRISSLKRFGSGSLAYSSLQEGLQYFMVDQLGYLSYVQLPDNPNSILVLADPICSKENKKALLEALLLCKNDPVFLHIDRDTGQHLANLGFCVNEFGVETFIDIQEFGLVGNKKQQLRAARNRAMKDGITVQELDSADDALIQALKKISDNWLQNKVASDAQMKFLVRPLVYVDEIDVRRFVAILDGKICGFVIFDPMYEDEKVVGYIANQLRSNLNRAYSVCDFIILEALEVFKAEGKKVISLGLSPLAQVDDTGEFKHSKLLKAHLQLAFERANFLYNFKNLAHHKKLYRPELPGAREEKVYTAMKERFMLNRMVSVCHVLGLRPGRQALAYLVDKIAQWWHNLFHKNDKAPQLTPSEKNRDTAQLVAAGD